MKLDLEKISFIYGESSIYEFKDNVENLTNNINYLSKIGFSDVYDIVALYPYLFIIEENEFKEKIDYLINKLGVEFSRYKDRWDKLAKSIQTVNKDVENVYITTDKITKKFNAISTVEIDKLNNIKEDE